MAANTSSAAPTTPNDSTSSKSGQDDKSNKYHFRVELRQIDRLYDFDTGPNVQFLLGGTLDDSELRLTRFFGSVGGRPSRVLGFYGMYGQPGAMRPAPKKDPKHAPAKNTSPYKWTYIDNKGEDVDFEKLDALQYQFRTDTKWNLRTFDRKSSTPIKECWVYVFQARDPMGKTAQLLYELQFDKSGQFQRMDPVQLAAAQVAWIRSQATKSAVTPPLRRIKEGTPLESALHLDLFVVEGATSFQAQYYFYLTPWQLPWDAIERIRNAPWKRATHFCDPFHTDVFTGDDPSTAKPLLKKPSRAPRSSAKDGGYLSYLIHLLNPLDEAQHRSDDLGAVLNELESLFPKFAGDEKYTLAKAVELFTMKNAAQRGLVEGKLTEYLYPNEEKIERFWKIAMLLTEELICWIGQNQTYRTTPFWSPEHPGDSPNCTGTGDPPPNPYEEAISYYQNSAQGIDVLLAYVINSVSVHLPKTPSGQRWLDTNLKNTLKREQEYIKRRTGQSDQERRAAPSGGLDYLFYANSTLGKELGFALKYTHTIYASSWVRWHNQNAIVKLTQWFEKRGCPIGIVDQPLGISKTAHPETGEPMFILDKETTGRVDKLAFANKGFGLLRSTIGLYQSLYALRGSTDQRTWFTASAFFLDWLNACRDLKESWKVVRTTHAVDLRAFSPLALYSATVGVVNGLDDLMRSRDGGEATGRGIQLIAALVSLAGIFATGGMAAVVYAVSVVLQFAGKWIAFEYETTNQFLRECEFGEKAYLFFQDGSLGGRAINPYRQLREANQWSPEAQRKEMERLMHRFDHILEVEDWSGMVHSGAQALPPEKRRRLAQLQAAGLAQGRDFALLHDRTYMVPSDARPCVYLVISFRYPHCLAADWTCGVDLKVTATGMGTVAQISSSLRSDQLRTWDPKGDRRLLGVTQDGSLKIQVAELDPAVYAPRLSSEELAVTGKVFVTNQATRQLLFTYEIEDSAWVWTRGEGPTLNSQYNNQEYLQKIRSSHL